MTHAELVERAGRWLRGTGRRSTVVTRATMWTVEQPDAIGWNSSGESALVECKASRADFLRDRKKHFRQFPALGMGTLRYYMARPGLLRPDEVPKGWGLLECEPCRVRVVRKALPFHEKNVHEELRVLLAALRQPPALSQEARIEGVP